jgi:hypothetical protein
MLSHRFLLPSLAIVGLVGCGETASPTGAATRDVSFSVSTAEAITAGAALADRASFATTTDGPLIIVAGADTLRIDSVRVVLAQVTLRQLADTLCGTTDYNDAADPTCTDLNTGPFVVKLPLTAGALSLFDIPIPKGTYTGFAVRVHKPNTTETGPNVVAFLAAHPEWLNKSAMVDGTFDGVAFHWSHDPPIQLTHTFTPPLVIDATTGSNFTLRADVASWFKATSGVLINPNAPTNALYPQIAANVATSFKVFKDDTKRGHDDGT